MSDDRNKAGEIARNIWLAGVGAYGRAVNEAQGRLEKSGTPKLFRDLVKAGAALEDEARIASQEARDSVEDRIQRVRENFSLSRGSRGDDLSALHAKIDRLSAQVEALTRALEAAVPAASGTPGRKKTTAVKKPASAKKSTRRSGTTKATTGTRGVAKKTKPATAAARKPRA